MDPAAATGSTAAGARSGVLRAAAFAATVPAAALVGYFAVRSEATLHIAVEPSPLAVIGGAVALAAAVALVRWPAIALATLVAAVYLNLSDVLVRHGLPSLLQLLMVPMLLAALGLRRRRELARVLGQPLTWLLATYVMVVLFSTTYAQDVGLAQERFSDFAQAFVLYLLVLSLAGSREYLRVAVWTVLAAAAFLSALVAVQTITGDFSTELGGLARARRGETYGGLFGYRVAGPLGDPNFFAQILVPAVPIGLFLGWQEQRARWKAAAFLATGLVVFAVLLTYSRGGALALGLVLALSLVAHGMSWRRLVLASVALVVATMLLMPSGFAQRLTTIRQLVFQEQVLDMDSSFEERLVLMGTAAEMFSRNPLAGVGAANYPARYGEYVAHLGSTARDYEEPGATRYPHNLYLEVAAETGIIGLVVFLGVLAFALYALGRARRVSLLTGDRDLAGYARSLQIALIGYLASSLFLHGDFERYLWLLFALAAAALAASPALVPGEDPTTTGGARRAPALAPGER